MEIGAVVSPVPVGGTTENHFPVGPESHRRRRVFVTVPVRNEGPRLLRTIERLEYVLESSGYDWVLGVAVDGSTDHSASLLRGLAPRYPYLIIQTSPSPLGRGLALRRLWSTVTADTYAFTDADLAAGPEAVVAALREIDGGADVAVGSRSLPGSIVRRPPLRNFASHSYNWIIRRTFNDGIADHQCGLKAFSRLAVARLLPQTNEDSWFWDTEVLVRAVWNGFRVVEFPVEWTETKYPTTSLSRLMSDALLHGSGLLRLKGGLDGHMRQSHGIPPRPSLVGLPRSRDGSAES